MMVRMSLNPEADWRGHSAPRVLISDALIDSIVVLSSSKAIVFKKIYSFKVKDYLKGPNELPF
jgi:hypothetical protein